MAATHIPTVFWVPFAVVVVALLVMALRSIWGIWHNEKPPKLDR
jgi:hypothetical protein